MNNLIRLRGIYLEDYVNGGAPMQNSFELFRTHICRGRQLDRTAAFLLPDSSVLEEGA